LQGIGISSVWDIAQINFASYQVPPRITGVKVTRIGVTTYPDGRATIALNGEPLKISDVYQASLCVQSILG